MRGPVLILWSLATACSSATAPADASVIAMTPDAFVETCTDTTDPRTVDFFGESCTTGPAGANAPCHSDDTGWCIEGTCRPMCSPGCPRCPGGTAQIAPAGACYCIPRS